jgi:hypothetical protein
MAVFAFLPAILAQFFLKSGNAIINMINYDLIMMWIHKFDLDTILWLGANLKNVEPDLILSRVMPQYTLFSLGIFRYFLFVAMALMGFLDKKFELIKDNVRKNFVQGAKTNEI